MLEHFAAMDAAMYAEGKLAGERERARRARLATASATGAGASVASRGNPAPAVDPASATPALVNQPSPLTAAQLRSIMPHAGSRADLYVQALIQAMTNHGINTPVQRAVFLAQISDESRQLHSTVEDLYYSAHRAAQIWPSRFPTTEAAAPYSHNPEALGNHVYSGRNGNGNEASGDGYRFRGRGLLMITGRAKYQSAGFENNPEAMEEPKNAANTAAAYWASKGLNRQTGVLDRTEFDAVSKVLNGGMIGEQARWEAYQRALAVLVNQ